MNYHCAKFADFSFSRFGFIMRTDRQTHTHRITDVDDCYTHATKKEEEKKEAAFV